MRSDPEIASDSGEASLRLRKSRRVVIARGPQADVAISDYHGDGISTNHNQMRSPEY